MIPSEPESVGVSRRADRWCFWIHDRENADTIGVTWMLHELESPAERSMRFLLDGTTIAIGFSCHECKELAAIQEA